jgi:hypothetical protein
MLVFNRFLFQKARGIFVEKTDAALGTKSRRGIGNSFHNMVNEMVIL